MSFIWPEEPYKCKCRVKLGIRHTSSKNDEIPKSEEGNDSIEVKSTIISRSPYSSWRQVKSEEHSAKCLVKDSGAVDKLAGWYVVLHLLQSLIYIYYIPFERNNSKLLLIAGELNLNILWILCFIIINETRHNGGLLREGIYAYLQEGPTLCRASIRA